MKGAGRFFGWAVAIVLVALPIVGVLQGWFASHRWPVTKLTVQATFHEVTGAQLRAAVIPQLGKGFFALNLDKVQHAVAAIPWVQSVEARKRWPDTLLLRITEREPFAHWNGHQLISRKGEVFDGGSAVVPDGLPVLSGPDDQMSDVVAFYVSLQRAFVPSGLKIVGVSLTPRGSWAVQTSTGARIEIGSRDLARERLHRFLGVYRQLQNQHPEGFAYADLRYTNGFAVRWEPSRTAPSTQSTPHT
ncbi:cell division protein FtsQ/DivIB [Frateuria aurantia]